ncbi:hypothetical protein AB0O07_23720 [Streptomyces sp. NPDC093085]|uniref:hypothetical protein n=1 Tax=Streptomyces sp. NPDC093085 TaxID=3155068 RepID=UPI003425C816
MPDKSVSTKPQQQPPYPPSPDGPKPPIDLAPEPGCDLCAWWDRRRENAKRGIAPATPLECARQIAAHPHRRAGDPV